MRRKVKILTSLSFFVCLFFAIGSTNFKLKQPKKFPFINNQVYAACCADGTCFSTNPESNYPVNQPDINFWDTRTYDSGLSGIMGLIPFDHPDDPNGLPPQLTTLIENTPRPAVSSLHQVCEWNWVNNSRAGAIQRPIDLPPEYDFATLVGFATSAGQKILVPESDYSIGGGNEVLVLYATENRITIKYTGEDSIASGYAVHLSNFNVRDEVLQAYQEANANGRQQLPALPAGCILGTAKSSEILVAIRDTGAFMDPRWSINDWWQTSTPASANTECKPEDFEPLESKRPETKDLDTYFLPSLLRVDYVKQSSVDPLKDKYIHNLVIDQGYQVYMPSPELTITQNTKGDWEAFMDWLDKSPGVDTHIFGTENQYSLDLKNGRIPLFRGSEASENTEKISSFEGYFASNNPDTEEMTTKGVLNGLLSLEQQCQVKVNNLKTAKDFCLEKEDGASLLNPELCALHEQIPNSDYYLFSTEAGANAGHPDLLTAFNNSGLSCEQLAQPWSENTGVDRQEFLDIQGAIMAMPFSLDKVYRWAFIIIAPLIDEDQAEPLFSACGMGNGEEPEDRFCMLWKPNSGGAEPLNRYAHAPIFGAFKIPMFGTNKIRSLKYFQDASEITADSLLSLNQQKAVKEKIGLLPTEEKPDIRSAINGKIEEVQEIAASEDERIMSLQIFCRGMPMCDCAHDSCPLRRALVDIINAQARTSYSFIGDPAPHVMAEKAGDINTSSFISYQPSRIFNPQFDIGKDVFFLAQRDGESGLWRWGLKVKDTDNLGDINDEQHQEVKVFVVAPIDNDNSALAYLEESMKSFFTQQLSEKMIETNCLADGEGKCGELPLFYPYAGASFGFKSMDTQHFHDPSKSNQCPCADGGFPPTCIRTQCENNSASVIEDDQNVGLYLPGARFGWYVRKIQETMHQIGSIGHDYITSCERTEDLFLGRCGGADYGPGGRPSNGSSGEEGYQYTDEQRTANCRPVTNSDSPCTVEKLTPIIKNYPANKNLTSEEIAIRALQASVICHAESGGDVEASNKTCLEGTSIGYAIGPFQINLLAHGCPQYFEYTRTPPGCTLLVDQSYVDNCENMVRENNLDYTMQISQGGEDWSAWETARPGTCGPILDEIAENPDISFSN